MLLLILSSLEDAYYYKLILWPSTLCIAVYMVLQLCTDYLRQSGDSAWHIFQFASKQVRRLRWVYELPTLTLLYFDICWARQEILLSTIATIVLY